MLGQAFGSAVCTAEALSLYRPDVFFDTTGHAFGYPLARLAGCRVAAYVHYPAVSTDMIRRVRTRAEAFNNDARVARSALKSTAKLVYYNLFAMAYGLCGKCASVAVCNSSWTQKHVRALWGGNPPVVFPPCDVDALLAAPTARPESESKYVLSVGQFRPEKDHAMQLRAWAAMKRHVAGADGKKSFSEGEEAREPPEKKKGKKEEKKNDPALNASLRVVGGCRGAADVNRLASLRSLAKALNVEDSVEFHVDVPFDKLRELLAGATAGLHTMVDEHFGICVVEYMAAGAIPVAHASAGPAMDIVVPAFANEETFLNDHALNEAKRSRRFPGVHGGGVRGVHAPRAAHGRRGARRGGDARARARAARFDEARFADGLRAALAGAMEEMDARDKRRKDLRDVVAKERIARTPSPRKGRGSPGGSPAGSPGLGFFFAAETRGARRGWGKVAAQAETAVEARAERLRRCV
jgi:alpha-1,2-mannosyltransferase